MRLGVATQRSIEWNFGRLSFLEAGAPGDPALLLLHGLGSRAFERALIPFLQSESG